MKRCIALLLVLFLRLSVASPSANAQTTNQTVKGNGTNGVVVSITNSIAVGGVTSNSARFWIRTNASANLNIQVSLTSSFISIQTGTNASVSAATNFAGIVNVSGLLPNTKYFYRAVLDGSPVDRADGIVASFTTFPLEGTASTFTFAFGSCQQSGSLLPSPTPPGNVFKQIAKDNPKFFLQIGDWSYPDSTENLSVGNFDFFPNQYSRVQQSYLTRFKSDYGLDTLLTLAPVDYVWDDHDYMNDNASGSTVSLFTPYKVTGLNDFIVSEVPFNDSLRTNSIKGYKEQFPGYALVNESRGIYHKFTYGNVEVFAVDLRAQRRPNFDALKKNTSTSKWEFVPPAGHSILGRNAAPGTGESQYDWFLNALKNSTAKWKFVMSSVPFNKSQIFGIYAGIALQDSVLGIDEVLGLPAGSNATGFFAAEEFADKWAGFPGDQDSLLAFIASNNIKNVIMMSGDSHNAAIDDGTLAGLPEIMAGGLDITNSKIVATLASLTPPLLTWNKGGQGLNNANFNNAYGKITVFGADSVQLALVDEFGVLIASHTVTDGTSSASGNTRGPLPQKFELSRNFPNPFNPSTTFMYAVPRASDVKLEVYDVTGRKIATLVDGRKEAGVYNVVFNASRLSSGVYFYRLTAGAFSESKKMLLVK
ncbi:MAG: alkaline phosphatase D family protein [Rhizobacter sp.]|nr:alkaline phosphatase D family protein [Chlorobiales bacterium]